MALSSSLQLLLCPFVLCILVAHAVPDLPDQEFVSITEHKLRDYVYVATALPDGNKIQWAGSCFQTNQGWLEVTGAYVGVWVYASNSTGWICADYYKFYTVDGQYLDYMKVFNAGGHWDVVSIARSWAFDNVKANGVAIHVDKSGLQECMEKKERGLNVIKEVV